ncbi:Protein DETOXIFICATION (Multidrug and toxic compound extrusion protein) [Psidium guajava]|nr:Protein DETOXIFICATION (Multidrug and toxic compound extrusion protein) [Psidium guajava]
MDDNVEQKLSETSNLKGRIWSETKLVWKIILPSMFARVSAFGIPVVTQIFIGHISEVDLAAYGLIQSVLLLFVNGVLLGMSSATETLCGQAFGAGQYHMLGIYLQRSWIVDAVTATILLPVFIFATPLFRLLGESDEVAAAAGEISLWFIPFLYYFVFSLTTQMYLQAQLKNSIIGWLCCGSFVLHLLLSWIMVSVLKLGVPGAMIALNISGWSTVIGAFIYIFGGWCPQTWKGFTKAAFVDLIPVIKLSISSGVMLCLELWYSAILVLLAGYMQNATVAISAFSLCISINSWEFMICLGFLTGACVRVSNELGRGNAKAAMFSVKVIISNSLAIGILFWVLFLAFGDKISRLFTSNEEVAEAMSGLSVLLAFSFLLNSVQPVLIGVAIGAGIQSVVAIVNVCCYYLVGIPIGVLLGYVAGLEIKGLWVGLLCGVLAQTLVLSFLTWRTNWEEQVNKASKRLEQWLLEPEEPTETVNHA